ncbi:MAG: Crp/Fnr family transcriptional regulator [Polyangiales bacterium]
MKAPITIEHRKLLAKLELFADLELEELESVVALTKPRMFAPHDVVVRQGDPADAAFAIAYGRLKVVMTGDNGRESALNIMGRGDVFGELSILDGGTRSASVSAIEPTLLLVIERVGFHALLRKSPRFAYKMLCVVARRLRRLSERTEDASLDVYTRLVKRLVQLSEQYGEKQRDGSVLITLAIDQRELGELLGTTRESVNKNLRLLQQRGLAQWSKKHVLVTDLAGLRRAGTRAQERR